MSGITTIVNANKEETGLNIFDDMFSELPPIDPFLIKQTALAANLAALATHSGKNRTEIAEKIGWHKSALTRLLSGRGNPALKTIWDFASNLGYDFDIVFHNIENEAPKQPWQLKIEKEVALTSKIFSLPLLMTESINIKIQNDYEVLRDFQAGSNARFYFSIGSEKMISPTINLPEDKSEKFLPMEFFVRGSVCNSDIMNYVKEGLTEE